MRAHAAIVLSSLVALASLTLASKTQAQDDDGTSAGLARSLEAPGPTPLNQVDVPPPPGAPPADEAPLDQARYPLPTDAYASDDEDEPSLRIPSRVTTRMRSLDASLRALGASGSNVVNAVLSMLTGGLSITLGVLRDPNDDWLSAYLYVYGGAAAARGGLELLLAPDASGQAIRYQHMPITTNEQVRARVRFGEAALSGLAEQAMIARVVDASLNLAAGVAVVPIYLVPNDFSVGNPLDYFVLIGAGVSVLSAVINLATPSGAEQRWAAYEALRDRLAEEADEGAAFGEEPVPSAPAASLSVSPFGLRAAF
ncbi:MAG: hypothetical protein AB8I08_38040 [Sandaracinaceae bacterium]